MKQTKPTKQKCHSSLYSKTIIKINKSDNSNPKKQEKNKKKEHLFTSISFPSKKELSIYSFFCSVSDSFNSKKTPKLYTHQTTKPSFLLRASSPWPSPATKSPPPYSSPNASYTPPESNTALSLSAPPPFPHFLLPSAKQSEEMA